MLRWVRARLRRDGVSKDLRWNEKPLKKAIDQWSAVYVAENQPLQDQPPQPAEGSVASRPGGDDIVMSDGMERKLSLHSDGISFDFPKGRKLTEPVKQALRRIHPLQSWASEPCRLGTIP